MQRARPAHTLLAAALLIVALAPLTGCTRTESETAVWIPYAEADLVTVGRSSQYTVVRGKSTDLMIYETQNLYGGSPVDRLTWLIQFDADSPLQAQLPVGPDSAARGWILEEIEGKPSHAAPLHGSVSIVQRSAESLAVVLNVYAVTDAPTAGEAAGDRIRLARKVEYSLRLPETLGAYEVETRAGTDTLREDDD